MRRRRYVPTEAGNRAPVLISHADRLGRIHWYPTGETGAAQLRFDRFQRRVLTEIVPPLALIPAHLLAFHGIHDLEVLERSVTAAARAYRWRNAVRIEWSEPNGYVDARLLSPLTQIAISRIGALNASPRQQIDALADWLAPDGRGYRRLQGLLDDSRAWGFLHLPGYALAHCTREAPVNLLTRCSLAREASGRALESPPGADTERLPLCEVLDVAISSPCGIELDVTIVERLVACTRSGRKPGGSYASARQRMLDHLGEAAPAAARGGRITALLAAWLIDLVESGSRRTALYAPRTITLYTSAAAIPLAQELALIGGLPSDAAGYEALYAAVKSTHSTGRVKDCASALACFHRFAVRWLEAPMLTTRLHADIPVDVPAAETVWPHELVRAIDWARDAADERMGAQLALGLALGGEIRIRAREVLNLRLRNVRLELREVEVYPLCRDGRTKSSSGVRLGRLRNDAVHAQLADWIARRRKEGACDEDLVFGDPHADDRIYRAGLFLVGLTRLLQAATGDEAVTFHTLSHRFVTERVSALDPSTEVQEINPLDELAAEAGHFSIATSLKHYAHDPDMTIRCAIDRAVVAARLLNARLAAQYAGLAPATLRQRAHRAAPGAPDASWAAITDAAHTLSWPAVEDGVALAVPVAPAWLGVGRASDLSSALNALIDLAAGSKPELVALRTARPGAWVERLAVAAAELMIRIGLHPPRRRLDPLRPAEAYALITHPARRHAFDLARGRRPRFAAVASRLGGASPDCAQAFCAWTRAYQAGHLSLEEFDVAQSLITFLAAANVPTTRLAIAVHGPASGSSQIRALRGLFRAAYGVSPPVFERSPLRGRPDHYLVWSSRQIEPTTSPSAASCCLDGFHALMLAYGALNQAGSAPTNPSEKL